MQQYLLMTNDIQYSTYCTRSFSWWHWFWFIVQSGTDDYGRLPRKVANERYKKALADYPDPENMMGSAARETWLCIFDLVKKIRGVTVLVLDESLNLSPEHSDESLNHVKSCHVVIAIAFPFLWKVVIREVMAAMLMKYHVENEDSQIYRHLLSLPKIIVPGSGCSGTASHLF